MNSENSDVIKISNIQLQCYKFYKLKINTTQRKIVVNFNEESSSHDAFFKIKECVTNFDCLNSDCNLNKCVFKTDEYLFGRYNEDYYDMFIGAISIKEDTSTKLVKVQLMMNVCSTEKDLKIKNCVWKHAQVRDVIIIIVKMNVVKFLYVNLKLEDIV